MKLIIGIIFILVTNSQLMAQNKEYFKHLVFRETPYSKAKGRIPLSEDQIQTENYFKLEYDKSNRLVLIEYKYKDSLINLNRSGVLDGKRALASKTKIEYISDKEIRTFFDKNNRPVVNGMGVFKEVYYYDKKGRRIALKYFDKNDKPINNSWEIHEYKWKHIEYNSVLEKRKNIKGKYTSMRPYYKFYNVLYKFKEDGVLLSMSNVNDKLELLNDETGIAIDKAIYDNNNNLISFKFFNAYNKPVIGSFLGTAGGFATYDDKGNCLKYATVGLDGNYMMSKRSNDAYSKYKFDDLGNLIERSNFDQENRLLNRRGVVRVNYIYDKENPLQLLKTELHHINQPKTKKDSILKKLSNKIPKNELLEDYKELLEVLKQHPSQFEFISEESYTDLVNKQRALIKDSMTVREFYQIASPIVTSLGCLHTRIVNTNFFKIPYKYWLPIIVRFENNKMYAINNCVENLEMNLGSEILEINGVSSSKIYRELKQTISADAFNKQFYKGDLNVNFIYYYHSLYGFSDKYEIKFKPFTSKAEIVTAFYIDEPAPNYKLELKRDLRLGLVLKKESSTAIIRIKNFNFFSRGKQNIDYFKRKLDDFIDKIKEQNIRKVVFDLRGNRGGNPKCTEYLLSCIISDKLNFYVDNEVNNERKRPIVVTPLSNNLSDRKTYMLTDGRCASATAQMLAVVKHNKLAIIVGEETGGTFTTFPGKRVKPLTNTKLSLQLGTVRESVNVEAAPLNIGIKPDIQIIMTINDIIEGKTPLLNYVYLDELK